MSTILPNFFSLQTFWINTFITSYRRISMGCSGSKIDDKKTTKQCKQSKAYIKQSISTHASFVDAHSTYDSALKDTGTALSDYAGGEPRRSNVKNVSLLKTFKEIDECFISASESAIKVSRILEANKLHHHSNRDNRGKYVLHIWLILLGSFLP